MLEDSELWTVGTARAWLRGYSWGHGIAATLEPDAGPLRTDAWVRMVMGMHAVMKGAAGDLAVLVAGADDELDLAGWPALVADLYE